MLAQVTLQSNGPLPLEASNEMESRDALPPVVAVTDLTPGRHQIGFSMTSGETNSDGNDISCAAVFF